MDLRSAYFRNIALAVAGVSISATLIALAAQSVLGGWLPALAAGAAFASLGAIVVASRTAAPLRRLANWLRGEEPHGLRLTADNEWREVAARINAFRLDTGRRLAESVSELDLLRAVLSTMADGVLLVGAGRHIILVNPAAASMLGVIETEALGRTVIECTMNTTLDDAVGAAMENPGVHTVDLDILFPQPRRIRAVVSASGDQEGRAVIVLQDQSEAIRLDQMRRDFVANVGHELRTPVTGIQTLAENLLEGGLDDPHTTQRFVEHILASSRRLVVLVDDVLQLAHAESKPPVERARVALAPLARAVVAGLDHAISEKGLDVGVDAPEGLAVWGDSESVRQILSNLVDNAVKYTPAGGSVEITARREGDMVLTSVADTGIGIPAEHQARVYERFYRVDRARSRRAGGTGLGLSIVRHLIEALEGSMTLDSTPGRGSTFTVVLPAAPEPGAPYTSSA